MILHLFFDDKFGEYVTKQFASYSYVVRFIQIRYQEKEAIRYPVDRAMVRLMVYRSPDYMELLNHLGDYSAVVMHGLFTQWQYDIVRALPNHVKLVWTVFGAEIYSRNDTINQYLSPISLFCQKVQNFRKKLDFSKRVPIDILRRVDYCMEGSVEVYEDAKNYIGNSSMQYLQYTYYTLEQLIGDDLLNARVDGNNVMVGNSASIETNSIEVLLRLRRIGLQRDSKLYMPLSYGDLWIKNFFAKVAKWLFPKNAEPMLSYMTRDKYNAIVRSCSIVIENHYRPNALGNVITALWLGAKVYVSKRNTQTRFLQRLGLKLFIIEDDLTRGKNIYAPLTEEEVQENRRIIESVWSKDQVGKYVDNIVQTLENEK